MRILERAVDWLLKPFFGNHPRAKELEAISDLLDRNPDIARLAHDNLTNGKKTNTGRKGMSGDQVIRVLLLKQLHRLTYRELEFHLQDSLASRVFARAPTREPWRWTTLQSNIKRLHPTTLEAINRVLVRAAKDAGIEEGEKIRTDCTPVESNIHEPSDSSLLCDGVRVLTRILRTTSERVPSIELPYSDHRKRARRRHFAIEYPAKGKRRKQHLRYHYRDLLKVARLTCSYARRALTQLEDADNLGALDTAERATATMASSQLRSYLEKMARVIDQTTRRVLHGESVPASEKVLSLFETHTDVIVKGERDVVFGHKVCLTSGASSLILDCFVWPGNPGDSTMVRPVIERQVEIYGEPPRQATFDGGFASKQNLEVAKTELGVQDVAFHKKCGLEVEEMTSSERVYRHLRRFRSGIEGIISTLKSAGMGRCSWRSQDSLDTFQSFIWSCVLAFNVSVIARSWTVAST